MLILCLLAKNNILLSGSTVYLFPLYIFRDSTHARILKFKTTPQVNSVTYTDRYLVIFAGFNCQVIYIFHRLAFTKAERLLSQNEDEERWVLSLDPKLVQEVNVSIDLRLWVGISLYTSIPQASQETMLVQEPNPPNDYSFAVRIHWLMLGFL